MSNADALRLAYLLEQGKAGWREAQDSASELRRLVAENERLRSVNAELLAALRMIVSAFDEGSLGSESLHCARALITKHEGEKA